MTEERLPLAELLQKAGEGGFLRSVAEVVLQPLMEADAEGLIGAGRHERSPERLNYRNGYRDRALASAIARARVEGIIGGVVVFAVIYLLLFTTFFTNWTGYMEGRSGFLASVKYWWAQHDVVRGDQPFYYYALFAPIYEYLPLALSLAAGWRYLRRPDVREARGNDGSAEHPSAAAALFVPLLMAWAAGVFWIFSWAGEKMPWLLVHMVGPMTFLAGRWVADSVDGVDWSAARAAGWKVAGKDGAAAILGIPTSTLNSKIKSFGIEIPSK